MKILEEISSALQRGDAKKVNDLVLKALEDGIESKKILNEGLLAGMGIIGEKFKKNEVFVPEVLIAARAMNFGMKVLEPILAQSNEKPVGKVLIGTVKGDLHDIGKNLVAIMMKGAGLEVIDIGVDISPEIFADKAEEEEVDIVAMSALLTTTMSNMKGVLSEFQKRGIRNKYTFMAGGAPVNENFVKEIGADYYTADAGSAAEVAKKIVTGAMS